MYLTELVTTCTLSQVINDISLSMPRQVHCSLQPMASSLEALSGPDITPYSSWETRTTLSKGSISEFHGMFRVHRKDQMYAPWTTRRLSQRGSRDIVVHQGGVNLYRNLVRCVCTGDTRSRTKRLMVPTIRHIMTTNSNGRSTRHLLRM